MKRVLVIFTQAPYANSIAQEGLDAVLSACTMELDVTAVFIDDGVFLLKSDQRTSLIEIRQFTKGFAALADFGVEQVCVDEASLFARGLKPQDLFLNPALVNRDSLSELIRQHDLVQTF